MEEVDTNEVSSSINIAVQGCCHGELDVIYQELEEIQAESGNKVDLLLICGDFECIRDPNDLISMAVPPKYRHMKSFYKYYTGELEAPIKTVFIGGNHEASNVLQSLYYGGYVAKNIHYLGCGGVINFRGIRIAGLSGIYNQRHYNEGHFESPPYTDNTLRSIYHVRSLEIFRMKHLYHREAQLPSMQPSRPPVDIFLTHDWPNHIWEYGNHQDLLRKKAHFREDIEKGELGSPASEKLLHLLQPSFWFAGHMHVKFVAIVPHHQSNRSGTTTAISATETGHTSASSTQHVTRFLALGKVSKFRDYLQCLTIPNNTDAHDDKNISSVPRQYTDNELHFDIEWAAIIRRTHLELRKAKFNYREAPVPVTTEELLETQILLQAEYGEELIIPDMSLMCAECCAASGNNGYRGKEGNLQTDRYLSALRLPHIWTIPTTFTTTTSSSKEKELSFVSGGLANVFTNGATMHNTDLKSVETVTKETSMMSEDPNSIDI